MRLSTIILISGAFFLASTTLSAQIAQSSVLGEGYFEFTYGSAGVGDIQAFYSGSFGVLSASQIDAVAGLELDVSVSGLGTTLAQVEYRLRNTSESDSFSPVFFIRSDANGNGLFSQDSSFIEFPESAAQEEADRWEADDFYAGNLDQNINAGALDNFDACPESCDLVLALQVDLGTISPGESAVVAVGLSDDGQSLSERFVRSVSVDTAQSRSHSQLTLSAAQGVPFSLIFSDSFEAEEI